MFQAFFDEIIKGGLSRCLEEAKQAFRPIIAARLKSIITGVRRLALLHQLWMVFTMVSAISFLGLLWFVFEPLQRAGHLEGGFGLTFFGGIFGICSLLSVLFYSELVWWHTSGLSRALDPPKPPSRGSQSSGSSLSPHDIEMLIHRVMDERDRRSRT